jgi:hypothetical protein
MTSISDTEVVNAPGGLVELGFASKSTNQTITNNATAAVVLGPVTFVSDGSPCLLDLYVPRVDNGGSIDFYFLVEIDGAPPAGISQGRIWNWTPTSSLNIPCSAQLRFTPSAGSHTATIKAFCIGGNATVTCASSNWTPAFLRVSKILQASQLLVTQSNAPIVTSLPVGNLVTGQEVDLYVTSPYVGYQRYKWNGTAWYVIGDSRAQGVWQSFTPTLTQSSNVTFTINYAKYVVFGKTVMVNFNLSPTSSGVLNNNILLGFGSGSTALPTAASASGIHGNFRWFDAGVSNWVGTICGSNTTSVFFTNDGNGNNAGFSGTLTSGDVIEGSFFYEMA